MEIQSPIQIKDILILMYDDLITTNPGLITNYMNVISYYNTDPTAIQYAAPNPAYGANRVWKALIVAGQGIIMKSSAKLEASRDALNQVMDYVIKGDGFYEDGSFLQHGTIAYTGGYGANLLPDVSNLLYWLNGSQWEYTYANYSNVFKWIYDSYEPVIYKGLMMDMVRGREIASSSTQGRVIGNKVMGGILRLAQIAPLRMRRE